MKKFNVWMVIGLLMSGCTSYRFTSDVPKELRTMVVPVFENASGQPEINTVVTQYVLREFQREGTMKVGEMKTASLKLLGRLTAGTAKPLSFNRSYASRASEYRYTLTAEITLVETGTGRLLLDAVPVEASTTFLTYDDMLSGMQSAYPRAAKELSRAIVDTVLAYWSPGMKLPPVAPAPVVPPAAPAPESPSAAPAPVSPLVAPTSVVQPAEPKKKHPDAVSIQIPPANPVQREWPKEVK